MRNGNDCVACPIGTYTDTADATSCTSCPEGLTTLSEGSWNARECLSKENH